MEDDHGVELYGQSRDWSGFGSRGNLSSNVVEGNRVFAWPLPQGFLRISLRCLSNQKTSELSYDPLYPFPAPSFVPSIPYLACFPFRVSPALISYFADPWKSASAFLSLCRYSRGHRSTRRIKSKMGQAKGTRK